VKKYHDAKYHIFRELYAQALYHGSRFGVEGATFEDL
jgi:hypothetical protein